MSSSYWRIQTLIGWLTLVEERKHLTSIHFGQPDMGELPAAYTPLMKQAQAEINGYFAGSLRNFSLPLAPAGTAFQQSCWKALMQIPYGETRTYSQQAQMIGQPKATRAVGMANHRNPLPIVIPCHRVVGKNGLLTGYAGGLSIKRILLDIEKETGSLPENLMECPHCYVKE